MRVLLPLPDRDFDVTEVVVPWRALSDAGVEVVFATEEGATPACDPLLLEDGVIFGKLGALPENCALYRQLEKDEVFLRPRPYAHILVDDLDGLVLPGGHAKGMRQYLESGLLADKILAFMRAKKPVAAICHGTIALARTLDPATARSVVSGRRITGLPKWMEMSAWLLTAWKLGDYYRTYPEWVQEELERHGADFVRGPLSNDYAAPFVVEDDNLITARWPGDAQAFSTALVKRLKA